MLCKNEGILTCPRHPALSILNAAFKRKPNLVGSDLSLLTPWSSVIDAEKPPAHLLDFYQGLTTGFPVCAFGIVHVCCRELDIGRL